MAAKISGSRRSRRSRLSAKPATSLRCPYSVSKSTRLVKISPRSTSAMAFRVWSTPSESDFVCTAPEIPRPVKMSSILPIAEDRPARGGQAVQQGLAPGRHREVAAVRRALEVGGGLPHERPGDHPADAELEARDLVADAAPAVQLLGRDEVLVGRDLEDAVARRVEDRRAGAEVLLAQLLQDLGARGRLVAQDGAADPLLERLHDLGREAAGVDLERRRGHDAGHLPVPGGGVLARAPLRHLAEGAGGVALRAPAKVGVRLPIPSAVRFGMATAARGEDVAEGVAALVAEGGRVRRLPHAQAIADHHDGAAERPGHGPPSSQARREVEGARRVGAPRRVLLVAEPGALALRVTHRLDDDITPRFCRRPIRRARPRRPGGSRWRRSGRAPGYRASSARVSSTQAGGEHRVRARLDPRPQRLAAGIEDQRRARRSRRSAPAPARWCSPMGRPVARYTSSARTTRTRSRGSMRAAASASTRARMPCRRASPRRSAIASSRRRSGSSRAGPSKRPCRSARRYRPVPPTTIGRPAAGRDRRHGLARQAPVVRGREVLVGVDHVDEVMRDGRPLRAGRLRAPDVEPAVHLQAVAGHDLAAARRGQAERERALAGGGRAGDGDQPRESAAAATPSTRSRGRGGSPRPRTCWRLKDAYRSRRLRMSAASCSLPRVRFTARSSA